MLLHVTPLGIGTVNGFDEEGGSPPTCTDATRRDGRTLTSQQDACMMYYCIGRKLEIRIERESGSLVALSCRRARLLSWPSASIGIALASSRHLRMPRCRYCMLNNFFGTGKSVNSATWFVFFRDFVHQFGSSKSLWKVRNITSRNLLFCVSFLCR